MKLILIYGPPASGKLTVATQLSKLTGYKLLDNHRVTDYISEVFPRSEPKFDKVRSRLGRKARTDIFKAAAEVGLDLIATFAPLANGWQDFMRRSRQAVEKCNGEICFVHLLPSRAVLLERTVSDSRKPNKIATIETWNRVVGASPHAFTTFPDIKHAVIDNSELTPMDTAEQIIQYYRLLLPTPPLPQPEHKRYTRESERP